MNWLDLLFGVAYVPIMTIIMVYMCWLTAMLTCLMCVVWNFVLFILSQIFFVCRAQWDAIAIIFFSFSRFYYKYDVNKWILVAWYLLRIFFVRLFTFCFNIFSFNHHSCWRVFLMSWLYIWIVSYYRRKRNSSRLFFISFYMLPWKHWKEKISKEYFPFQKVISQMCYNLYCRCVKKS